MSYPQFQAAADYLGALADDDAEQALPSVKYDERGGAVLDGPKALNFMNFPVAGSAVTFDSCSFAPDSASTATVHCHRPQDLLRHDQRGRNRRSFL